VAAAAAAVTLDVSPVHAAKACGGQNQVEVVPDGGTFECEASQALPRDGRSTPQSSNTQFTASAVISSDGATVSVTASGAPDGATLHATSHQGISGDGDSAQAVFSGGTASVSVGLQCGQVDVKAVPAGVSGTEGVWRIAGPFITNTHDCGSAPTTAAPTTPAPTTPAPTEVTPTTAAPTSAGSMPSAQPTTGPTTTAQVLAGGQSNTSASGVAPGQALPTTGGAFPSAALLLALAVIAAGGMLVVAGRRMARDEEPI
jgi:hypothetical protein